MPSSKNKTGCILGSQEPGELRDLAGRERGERAAAAPELQLLHQRQGGKEAAEEKGRL
jgi:hypothetical protein